MVSKLTFIISLSYPSHVTVFSTCDSFLVSWHTARYQLCNNNNNTVQSTILTFTCIDYFLRSASCSVCSVGVLSRTLTNVLRQRSYSVIHSSLGKRSPAYLLTLLSFVQGETLPIHKIAFLIYQKTLSTNQPPYLRNLLRIYQPASVSQSESFVYSFLRYYCE